MKALMNMLLVVVVFAVGPGRLCRGASASDANIPNPFAAQPNDLQSEGAPSTADANGLQGALGGGDGFFVADPNLTIGGSQGMGTSELFYRAMFAVMLVIVLGGVAMYVSKRCLPRLARLSGKQIQVVETIYLGQHKSLHLVNVEGHKFLLGGTAERITKLADLDGFNGPFDLTGEDCEVQ
ncbi:MAG TPA: hypothetical protein ENN81_11980 [Phycisphaerales bacterium]|nr:hypothetical protein [Phycisphaerales bacterium]